MAESIQINDVKLLKQGQELQNSLGTFTDDPVNFYGSTDISGYSKMKDTYAYAKTTRQNVIDKTNKDVEKINKVVEIFVNYDESVI